MIQKSITQEFKNGLERVEMLRDEGSGLLFVSEIENPLTKITHNEWFSLEKAAEVGATAVYFRKYSDNRPSVPQIYIYDITTSSKSSLELKRDLADAHKKIWSSGVVPLVYVFSKTDISILDCTQPVKDKGDFILPNYLKESISIIGKIDSELKNYAATRFDNGIFWDDDKHKRLFNFKKNSAYQQLLEYLVNVKNELTQDAGNRKELVQKLIVQCILVKYLEEKKVFPNEYFQRFVADKNATCFCDVLSEPGASLSLFDFLNKNQFNGKIFEWEGEEREYLSSANLSSLVFFFDGRYNAKTGQGAIWRRYSFDYLPVELISRIYEEFLGKDNRGIIKKGVIYTPSHLVHFLIDECMPLIFNEIPENQNFKILDPACGSGIFLVSAFKRIVQWWRIKNENKKPTPKILKELLRKNIFGVDIEDKAAQLTTFSLSLALCELSTPRQILHELTFDNLKDENIVTSNFFDWKVKNKKSFDLIIGNPPFSRGQIDFIRDWKVSNDKTITIPQGQVSLKFLCETIDLLKEKGLQCLIMYAPGILYNSTTFSFRKEFFSKYNVLQIIDFTPLGRNKALWDNADTAAIALFTRNEKPDVKNILHLVIRRTKANKDRILFEVDDYDFNFVTKVEALNNKYIWKINLLGGSRIKEIITKLGSYDNFEKFLIDNKQKYGFEWGEGSNQIYHTLPTDSFTEKGIDYKKVNNAIRNNNSIINYKPIFTPPILLIKENIGDLSIPVEISLKKLTYGTEIMGINVPYENVTILHKIKKYIEDNNEVLRFYTFCTSGRVLVSKNTEIKKEDLMNLPFDKDLKKINLPDIQKQIIKDVLRYEQEFLRHGENSLVLKTIQNDKQIITFSKLLVNILNIIYKNKDRHFRLSDIVISKSESIIATVFKYDDKVQKPNIKVDNFKYDEIGKILEYEIKPYLHARRVVRIYKNDKLIIMKPNQLRYWLSITAFRDADKVFNELITEGY